jgi:hypothetical protein
MAAVVAMPAEAVAGAALYLHTGAALPLLVATLAAAATGIAFARSNGPAGSTRPRRMQRWCP